MAKRTKPIGNSGRKGFVSQLPGDTQDISVFSLKRQIGIITLTTGILLVITCYALTAGAFQISVPDVVHVLLDKSIPLFPDFQGERIQETIVWNMRVPRILLAIITGIALSTAGVVYQGCFKNPLVDPFILGVSSGAAFGAALGIVFPSFFLSIQSSAFLFATISVAGAYLFSRVRGYSAPLTLILAGIIMGSLFDGLVSVMKYLSSDTALRTIVFWIMGGFYYASWSDVILIVPVTIGSVSILALLAWKLNILSIGEEEARTLGVDPGRYMVFFIGTATLLTALVTASVGIIPWIGLMMPHAARMLAGPDHRIVIPLAALLGAIYLLICDTLARTLTSSEIPVGIIVSILGAPYLFWLIRTKGGMAFG
ncbi:MAG: iron ABC transporter permease [Methanospirillaceae archaeon]|nr:iron ABC transporter permease [Methanospirillaceae archaeon]